MSDERMLFMSYSDVIRLLEKAFEEGWAGYYDLKDSTVESLLENYLEERKSGDGGVTQVGLTTEPSFQVNNFDQNTLALYEEVISTTS